MDILSIVSRYLLTSVLIITSMDSVAHTVNESSARVILRDGQIEVRIFTDLNRLQSVLQNSQAWLMGDSEQVMPAGLNANQSQQFIERLLKNNTAVSLNLKPVFLDTISLITHQDNHPVEFVLLGKHNISEVNSVKIEFPKSLGPVHTSFVKPKYRVVSAGNATTVSIGKDEHKK